MLKALTHYFHILCATAVILGVGCSGDEGGIRLTETGTALVQPESFVFPKVSIGAQSETLVSIKNTGTGPLKLANLVGEFSAAYNLYWYEGVPEEKANANQINGIIEGENRFPPIIEISPEQSITFVMTYTAVDDTPPLGRLFFDTNEKTRQELIIPIRGDDVGPQLVVTPPALDFGRVEANVASTLNLTVTNTGQAVLDIEEFVMTGSEDFQIKIAGVDPRQTPILMKDPDQDGEDGVSPGQAFAVEIIYESGSAGEDKGELQIVNNSDTNVVNVPLVANGASPCINVKPDILDFQLGLLGGRNPGLVTIESCGSEPLRVSNVRLIGIEADGDADANAMQAVPFFAIDPNGIPPLPFALPALSPETPEDYPTEPITVVFSPTEEISYNATLVIESNDPINEVVEVPVRGQGSENECPEARVRDEQIVVRVNDPVILDGSFSTDTDAPDGLPIRFEWAFTQRPESSDAMLLERFNDELRPEEGGPVDDGATPRAVFYADRAGDYLVDLTVTDRLNAVAPGPACPQPVARVRVVAEGRSDIHVEMLWDTPEDDDQFDQTGADIDLHLRHPSASAWFDTQYDCSYQNPEPDWGALNQSSDNPQLDFDDADGAGPENITLDGPQDTRALGGNYKVGAHYYRNTEAIEVTPSGTDTRPGTGINFLGSTITVKVYLRSELVHQSQRELTEPNQMWEVGEIIWTEEDQRFEETDRVESDVKPF